MSSDTLYSNSNKRCTSQHSNCNAPKHPQHPRYKCTIRLPQCLHLCINLFYPYKPNTFSCTEEVLGNMQSKDSRFIFLPRFFLCKIGSISDILRSRYCLSQSFGFLKVLQLEYFVSCNSSVFCIHKIRKCYFIRFSCSEGNF